jgi:ABC-type multidrug transport system ATPase subunit
MSVASPSLAIEAVSIHRQGRPVLSELTLPVLGPGLVAWVGANGVGKSTLLAAVGGQLPLSSGRILLDGHSIKERKDDLRLSVSSMVAPDALPSLLRPLDYWQIVGWARASSQWAADAERHATRLGCWDDRCRSIGTLSLGQRMKVAIIGALLGDAPVVLMDEPLNGLDVSARIALRELLQEHAKGKLVIVVVHALDFAVRHTSQCVAFDGASKVLAFLGTPADAETTLAREAALEAFITNHPPR